MVLALGPPDSLLADLTNSPVALNENFGYSIATDGMSAVIAAPFTSDGGDVSIYDVKTGSLKFRLHADDFGGKTFGRSVGISGNLIVVGAPGTTEGFAPEVGRVYVFDASYGTLLATINNPSGEAGDQFGWSVSISGNRILVGAPGKSPGGVTNAGKVYVFDATTGAQTGTMDNPTPASGDQFGYSVGISGTNAVVGASAKDSTQRLSGFTDAGRAYIFDATTTNTLLTTLFDPTPADYDYFGAAVAIDGNVAVVGAFGDSPGGKFFAGTAYVFDVTTPTTGTLLWTLNNPTPGAYDEFGNAVAISGNFVAVGASGDSPGGISGAGSAYIFDATTGGLLSTLNNPDPTANDAFGYPVAISGNIAVVGAFMDDPSGVTDAGAAYAFIEGASVAKDATFTYHTIPPQLGTNQGMTVGLYVRNDGNAAWALSTAHALRITTDTCNLFGGVGQLNILAGQAVNAGQTYIFSGVMQAPSAPSAGCSLGFQMIQNNVPFGSPLNLTVDVVAATPTPNAARNWEIYE